MKKIILVVLLLLLNNVSYSQSLGWTLSDLKKEFDNSGVKYRVEVSEYGQHLLVTQIIDQCFDVYIFSPQDTVDSENWKVVTVVLNFMTKNKLKKNIKEIEHKWGAVRLKVPKNTNYRKEWRIKVDDFYVFVKSVKLDRKSEEIGIKGKLTFSYTH